MVSKERVARLHERAAELKQRVSVRVKRVSTRAWLKAKGIVRLTRSIGRDSKGRFRYVRNTPSGRKRGQFVKRTTALRAVKSSKTQKGILLYIHRWRVVYRVSDVLMSTTYTKTTRSRQEPTDIDFESLIPASAALENVDYLGYRTGRVRKLRGLR